MKATVFLSPWFKKRYAKDLAGVVSCEADVVAARINALASTTATTPPIDSVTVL